MASDPLSAAIAGALDWWRQAGLSHAMRDAAEPWLPPLAVSAEADHSPAAPRPDAPPPAEAPWGTPPADLAAFARWWCEEPTLAPGPLTLRVAPRGVAQPALMVLVAEPEAADRDRLLSGPLGALLESVLGAMALREDALYLASALPRHLPAADWPAFAAAGGGRLLRHHIGLVRPRQIIGFGRHVSALLGHDPAQKTANLPIANHHRAHNAGETQDEVPLFIAPDLAVLADRPAARAAFWRDWLRWTR